MAAICSFSGLEEFDGGPVAPGTTQTPHSEGENTFPAGVAAICRYLNPGKNPKPMPAPRVP